MALRSSTRLHSVKPKLQHAKKRTAHKRVSYREESSESNEFDESSSQDGDENTASSPPKPSRFSRPRHGQAESSNASTKRKASGVPKRPLGSKKRAKTSQSHEAKKHTERDNTSIHMTGRTMPWHTLPYQILVVIFEYASWPLVADTGVPLPSILWLLKTARCCKAFAEPALSALYYSPPLTPPTRARALINQLSGQNEHSSFNYGAKIKYLDIEATGTLLHKYAGHEPIDLGELVAVTPQLRGIHIHRLADDPRYRTGVIRTVAGRSVYQESLFVALQGTKIILRDWTWNQSMAKQSHRLANIREIHSMPPFQNLRTLSLVNYEDGPLEKGRRREEVLADALRPLPSLASLVFRMCSIVNTRLMPLLPENLQTLEIFDCPCLESPDLGKFLIGKGGSLQQLILDHNHSLNLSFLVDLARNCPKLEHLRMNLRYFNTFFTVRDVEPKYDILLQEGEIPAWPPNLQSLELYHLRKWSLATAELFFSSLTDASQSLRKLRQLRIKASLEESGWRDRISFRDKWTQRLQHVFLRKSSPPNQYLKSFAAFKAYKSQVRKVQSISLHAEGSKGSKAVKMVRPSIPESEGSSQMRRVEISRTTEANASDSDFPLSKTRNATKDETDSDAPLSKVRRSTRAKPHKDDLNSLSESSPNAPKPQRRRRRHRRGSDESSSEDSAIDDDGIDRNAPRASHDDAGLPEHIQGMCDVVDVLIDNLRPTESEFRENDFLDDEVSGDEDWNGDDDMPGDGYAW